ncbi:hypothetical protein [Bacterioplanoides sp.]|uniref:hypothetical protein n=1 Tax=Bacterioplanoides sp. TaxID=2066072 RepID=UPI003B002EA8
MGAKMSKAVDAEGREISLSDAENKCYIAPLRCVHCSTELSFTGQYLRQLGDDTVTVSACFKLKRGNVHKTDCPFDLTEKVTIVARESSPAVLSKNESGKYELRLLAVKEAIFGLRDIENKESKSNNPESRPKVGKEYVKSKKQLSSYLSTARQVLKIRAQCEDNREVEDNLELVFNGNRVHWKDFYFMDQDYFRCYTNLQRATINIPIAIQGLVRSTKVVPGKYGERAVLNLISPYRETDDPKVIDTVNISIWSSNLSSFDKFKYKDSIIIFGFWKAGKIDEREGASEKTKGKVYRNRQISMSLLTNSQICPEKS